jgi:hypothetical protein
MGIWHMLFCNQPDFAQWQRYAFLWHILAYNSCDAASELLNQISVCNAAASLF